MRRRDLLPVLSGAVVWPATVLAQTTRLPIVALISGRTRAGDEQYMPEVLRAFREAGFVDGQTMTLEERWTEGDYDQVALLVREMVGHGAAVLLVIGTAAALAAKTVTTTTPIVFGTADDPIAAGLVDSIARPSGNLTGATMNSAELRPKMLQLLHEVVPQANSIFVLANPNNASLALQTGETEQAAVKLGLEVHVLKASTVAEIDAAFAAIPRGNGLALLVASDPFLTDRHEQIVKLAEQHALPAVYPWREYAAAGGLISYGARIADTYHQTAAYAARILKGAKPADLPVVQPIKFELVINLKTARALGLAVPQLLLAQADEVIE